MFVLIILCTIKLIKMRGVEEMSNKGKIVLDRITCERGKRREGFIDVAKTASGGWISIPVIEIKGEEDGPVILVDSCIHGDEYEGSEAILQVSEWLENNKFKGTFIGVPALNLEAYCFNSRDSIIDNANMNRIFPGDSDKYITQRIAARYCKDVINNVDYCITFHGGGTVLHLESIIGYIPDDTELGKTSFEMAKAFGGRYTWKMQNLPFEGTSIYEIAKAGVPVILPEVGSHCGRLHDWEDNVALCKQGIFNTMSYLGFVEEEIVSKYNSIDVELHYVHTNDGGRHKLLKKENEEFKAGETLAEVKGLFGESVSLVKAPHDGIVIGYWSVPVIKPGDWSYLIGMKL